MTSTIRVRRRHCNNRRGQVCRRPLKSLHVVQFAGFGRIALHARELPMQRGYLLFSICQRRQKRLLLLRQFLLYAPSMALTQQRLFTHTFCQAWCELQSWRLVHWLTHGQRDGLAHTRVGSLSFHGSMYVPGDQEIISLIRSTESAGQRSAHSCRVVHHGCTSIATNVRTIVRPLTARLRMEFRAFCSLDQILATVCLGHSAMSITATNVRTVVRPFTASLRM
mmetsp:Transcript_28704/g.75653  ORF Transcript_28704/g.75653 Transcript_28704/m.75653 type:complete len:223 (+) Transcript_28704:446-1114(+)